MFIAALFVIKIIRTNINAQQDGVEIADIDGGGERGQFMFYFFYLSFEKSFKQECTHIQLFRLKTEEEKNVKNYTNIFKKLSLGGGIAEA